MLIESCSRSTSPKHKLKSLCCFRGNTHQVLDDDDGRPKSSRSPPKLLRSVSQMTHDVEVKGRHLISKINHTNSGRTNPSFDYSYDPDSYALNFEDESTADDLHSPSFTARLPASPPQKGSNLGSAGERNIAVYS